VQYAKSPPGTFARWRDSVPLAFRFSGKAPRHVSDELRLANAGASFATFANSLAPLEDKLGAILVQLPPSLAFDPAITSAFSAGSGGILTRAFGGRAAARVVVLHLKKLIGNV
jgi:uncharacterized protein YecE (DUF72 family)